MLYFMLIIDNNIVMYDKYNEYNENIHWSIKLCMISQTANVTQISIDNNGNIDECDMIFAHILFLGRFMAIIISV